MPEPGEAKPETTGTNKVSITKEMTTGEVTEIYPATREVFSKHFGKSCFDCPAFGTEDVNLACMMHNTDVEMFATPEEAKAWVIANTNLVEKTPWEFIIREADLEWTSIVWWIDENEYLIIQ